MDQSKEPQPQAPNAARGTASHDLATQLPDVARPSQDLEKNPGDNPGHNPGQRTKEAAADAAAQARTSAIAAFSALSNGDRLDLLRLLFRAGEEGMAAGEIARQLGLSASRLSFHLSQLEQAGLLRARKMARNVFYAVEPQGFGRALSWLLNDCCGDHPGLISCCQPLADRGKSGAAALNDPEA
ncbi:helix-turn-helix transcriptional regulator [Xinfangfangia sp. D13-10-4-6]|uniref:ArsR/SmtB family transcription factor n=1 Tax=Pseudogemmobacter hezensis TaxID=2737662 RepID=UPI0015527069|nr:helix-turn-helix domain-containing protein [Pseudogemmobacter hezensis]NPD13702.1 helix-turn-helix transcriptional regulator [Pseudogemmobacter hezensis]